MLMLESEWIRQFYIQGSQHHDLLWEAYWKEPMETLVKYWVQLEHRTHQTYKLLQLAAQGKCGSEKREPEPSDKAFRKLRDKQKSALLAIEALIQRIEPGDDSESTSAGLYESLAGLLDERASLRS